MQKKHYRDYATEAFRFLAREGGAEPYRQRVWNRAIESAQRRAEEKTAGLSAPTEAAVLRAQEALDSVKAELDDLEAAEWALATLGKARGQQAVMAVRGVYMLLPDRPLYRGEIKARVTAISTSMPAGEATIYRWLDLARQLFAERRGLRK